MPEKPIRRTRATGHPQAANASKSTPASSLTPDEREELRGDLFLVQKRFQKAIETYTDVLPQVQPQQPRQKSGFFYRLFHLGKKKQSADQPRVSKLLNKIGIAYQQLGNRKLAQDYFQRSCDADRHFASPRNNLGTVAFGRGKYKSAIRQYRKAIEINPKIATMYVNMGYAYFAWKKYPDAVRSFRQAIVVNPKVFQELASADVVVEDRGNENPGLYYYLLAKTFAMFGNAERCAHYLKMSRDEGYRKFTDARKDPGFTRVLKDARVRLILASVQTGKAQKR